jgi:hypothetical protein
LVQVIHQVSTAFTATEEYDGNSWTTVKLSLGNRQEIFTAGAGTFKQAALAFGGGYWSTCCYRYSSNRRMDRCRSTINSYNHSFLTTLLIHLINVERVKK